jgi:hypothetical protein
VKLRGERLDRRARVDEVRQTLTLGAPRALAQAGGIRVQSDEQPLRVTARPGERQASVARAQVDRDAARVPDQQVSESVVGALEALAANDVHARDDSVTRAPVDKPRRSWTMMARRMLLPLRAGRRSLRRAFGLALLGAALGPPAAAQPRVVGFQDCEKCHKAAVRKWRVEEPAQQGAKAHANTHKQLSDAKAGRFAAALGQADPLDPKGRCAACHATVVRGSVRTGVSCESCHGPASQWNPIHDDEPLAESYKKSLGLGLRDLHAKPAAIAALCVSCHVTPERELAAAGHPNGASFDAGASLRKLVHWTGAFTPDQKDHASYDFAQVTAAGRPLVAKALASAPPARPAGGGTAPARPGGGIAAGSPAPVAPAPAGPSAFDWDQPLPSLPDDYPSDDARPAPAPRPARRPSLVEDRPALTLPAVRLPEDPGAVLATPRPPSATSEAAQLRGQGLELLAKLLASGKRTPDLDAPRPPREFKGPDSELLNLQDIAFYLALETLRQAGSTRSSAGPR